MFLDYAIYLLSSSMFNYLKNIVFLLYREHFNGMYRVDAYFLTKQVRFN
jgi:hypothetical protein